MRAVQDRAGHEKQGMQVRTPVRQWKVSEASTIVGVDQILSLSQPPERFGLCPIFVNVDYPLL